MTPEEDMTVVAEAEWRSTSSCASPLAWSESTDPSVLSAASRPACAADSACGASTGRQQGQREHDRGHLGAGDAGEGHDGGGRGGVAQGRRGWMPRCPKAEEAAEGMESTTEREATMSTGGVEATVSTLHRPERRRRLLLRCSVERLTPLTGKSTITPLCDISSLTISPSPSSLKQCAAGDGRTMLTSTESPPPIYGAAPSQRGGLAWRLLGGTHSAAIPVLRPGPAAGGYSRRGCAPERRRALDPLAVSFLDAPASLHSRGMPSGRCPPRPRDGAFLRRYVSQMEVAVGLLRRSGLLTHPRRCVGICFRRKYYMLSDFVGGVGLSGPTDGNLLCNILSYAFVDSGWTSLRLACCTYLIAAGLLFSLCHILDLHPFISEEMKNGLAQHMFV